MPKISVNGATLYYEQEGNANETLIFGHSLLFNLRMFDSQVEFLKNNYTCIRFDFRGHGKSESTNNGYDLNTLTEDLIGLVKALNIENFHFIGFSMGGMVALRAAIKYPELIKSLILIDTSSEPEPKSGMIRNKAMLFVAKYFGLSPIAGKVMNMFFGDSFLQDPAHELIRELYLNYFLSNNRKGIIKAVKGILYRKGITNKLTLINRPTTILVGEEDILTDYKKAEVLQRNIRNSKLKVIPSAGHMSPVEEPEIVNSIIDDHLNEYYKNHARLI
ncbi:alpha/beta hydrolase [Marinigracilibium pacificum]|uniref:Alpha/beta hydrolase n=1 Tax=Marinigracilibium pacificum TaxID=2729599 RepID=A0A848J8T4_9BACT|nr:alpha/beta hydrolase [Marinigracilibium pacificum]NMM50789.1 alpha/beta hydrolase [Marinigracilibium pacificum]